LVDAAEDAKMISAVIVGDVKETDALVSTFMNIEGVDWSCPV
jgi:hypothetical protein